MRIANNAIAINTHRQYSINNANVANSTEKLSSGYRINRAGDDAAGLAISEKMRAQIKGLTMASKNSQDAISLVQTAEGALTETHSILQRMRELSVQAASDTNDQDVDRQALNEEFTALKQEIDDIAGYTKFNGKKLLDGSFAGSTATSTFAAGVSVSAGTNAAAGTYNVTATFTTGGTTPATSGDYAQTFSDGTYVSGMTVQNPHSATGDNINGSYSIITSGTGNTIIYELQRGGSTVETYSPADFQTDADDPQTLSLNFNTYGTYTFTVAAGATAANVRSDIAQNVFSITNAEDESTTVSSITLSINGHNNFINPATQTSVTDDTNHLTINFGDLSGVTSGTLGDTLFANGTNATITVSADHSMTIQTGADKGEVLSVGIGSMTTETLNIKNASIETREHASNAIESVNTAINGVSTQRAKLGAYQNRLQHKINNLDTSAENLQAAESRIRDLDMAKEMTNYTKNNILVQASTAMLAQANAAPQGVLQLLQ